MADYPAPYKLDGNGKYYLIEDRGITAPHPDGKPWPKCCGSKDHKGPGVDPADYCAFRRNEPDPWSRSYNQARCCLTKPTGSLDEYIKNGGVPGRFMCMHRQDGGYLRVCAGWHACFGKRWQELFKDK